MTEINFYTGGNSNDISTWSNVPYLFAKALERKGYKLNRFDILPFNKVSHLFNTLSFYIFKKVLHSNACPEFRRTWLHRFLIRYKLKIIAKKYPNAKINLFLSYAYLNQYSDKPNVLWCDWSDRIVIQRQGRNPKWYEKWSLLHEDSVIKKADAVYSLFPKCKEQMEKMYGRRIICINRNVINTVYDKSFNIEELSKERLKSHILLFIGNIRYIGGALLLINTVAKLKFIYPNLELHIIGMSSKDLNSPKEVICHGYLHKDIKEERELYYKLLLTSRCLINPTKGWAAYSSCIEAMYYGCPIIISPYPDFINEFGSQIDFGYYCDENTIQQRIANMLSEKNYIKMCLSAHNKVKDYTWDNYIDDFINSLQFNGYL